MARVITGPTTSNIYEISINMFSPFQKKRRADAIIVASKATISTTARKREVDQTSGSAGKSRITGSKISVID